MPSSESSSDDASSGEEDDDLVLEGVLVRNYDVDSSDEEEEQEKEPERKKSKLDDSPEAESSKTKSKGNGDGQQKNVNKSKKDQTSSSGFADEDNTDIVEVDFTFNDMDEKFFHGLKTLLLSNTILAPHSSAISDLIIDNVSVGTVVTSDDGEDNVFGFGSVLSLETYKEDSCIKELIQKCSTHCPDAHKNNLNKLFSGTASHRVGLFVHSRMVNLPLEIAYVLHEQIVLDLTWAKKNAEGGNQERKSFDFDEFIILAPCYTDKTTRSMYYKNFDDEVFSNNADFLFSFNSASGKQSNKDENKDGGNDLITVIVMKKAGYTRAMKELKKLIRV